MWDVLEDIENELSIPTKKRITKLNQEDLHKFIFNEQIEKHSKINIYSISFSKSFDSLPMWNMYGQNGNGICLGFDSEELNKYLKSSGMENLTPMIYGIGEDPSNHEKTENEINQWKEYIKYIYNNNMYFIKKYSTNIHEKNYDIKFALNNYILLLSIVPINVKNPAYKYEEEYRLYCRELNQDVFFRDRNGLLLPYVKVKLPLSSLKIVAIGPTADKNRQMMSIAKMLKEKVQEFNSLTFYSSEIPYISQ